MQKSELLQLVNSLTISMMTMSQTYARGWRGLRNTSAAQHSVHPTGGCLPSPTQLLYQAHDGKLLAGLLQALHVTVGRERRRPCNRGMSAKL
jgi:hypothetical protein